MTVLPMLVGSFYTGAAVVGVLFPLFIMLACDASPKQRFDEGGCVGLMPLPQKQPALLCSVLCSSGPGEACAGLLHAWPSAFYWVLCWPA